MANPQVEDGYTRIANDVLEALAKTRISGEARQVLDAVLRKTYGWRKKWDVISLSQLSKATGLDRRHVVRARGKLEAMRLLVPKKAPGGTVSYCFNKDYEDWLLVPKKARGVPKKGTGGAKLGYAGSAKLGTHKRKLTKETIQKKTVSPHHADAVAFWFEGYEGKFGTKPVFDGGKDGKIVQTLLKQSDFETLKRAITAFLADDDSWLSSKGGWTLGTFKSRFNVYAQREARRRPKLTLWICDVCGHAVQSESQSSGSGALMPCRRCSDNTWHTAENRP